ncbi:MAG: hypothetical protein C4330_09980 [Chitinophagaceae bacterium]
MRLLSHTLLIKSIFNYPQEFANKQSTGEVYFYRYSDASKDLKKSFAANSNNIQVKLPVSLSGSYELKLTWSANGKNYFNERKIFFLVVNIIEVINTALIMGAISSFHCIGMCGTLAFALPITHRSDWQRALGSLMYNFGRIFTCSALGCS